MQLTDTPLQRLNISEGVGAIDGGIYDAIQHVRRLIFVEQTLKPRQTPEQIFHLEGMLKQLDVLQHVSFHYIDVARQLKADDAN